MSFVSQHWHKSMGRRRREKFGHLSLCRWWFFIIQMMIFTKRMMIFHYMDDDFYHIAWWKIIIQLSKKLLSYGMPDQTKVRLINVCLYVYLYVDYTFIFAFKRIICV